MREDAPGITAYDNYYVTVSLDNGVFDRLDGDLVTPRMVGTLEEAEYRLSEVRGTVMSDVSLQPLLLAQPAPDWRLVNIPGWASQPGFSLRVPPGWRVVQKQGIDSYVGEVLGDGLRLGFDYGSFMWSLDPDDDPEHDYAVVYQEIGGVEGKLLIPVDTSGGFTGVYFARLDGPSLNLIGHDLTPEQQRTAIAIFRSIRSENVAGGSSIEELAASALTPQITPSLGGPARFTLSYEGIEYVPVAGPIREELLDLNSLEPTGLVLHDGELLQGGEGNPVYTLSGLPIEHGFLVRSINRGYGPRPSGGTGETSYPVCQQGSGAYVYTAEGASPPPWWPSSPQPAYPGGPTPTPFPTPTSPIVDARLSPEELLDLGWPVVNMERLQFEFRGVEYHYTGSGYINERGADTSISPVDIQQVETLSISYFIDVRPLPFPALEEIASAAMVTDYVPVYRLSDRPVDEVIVVDQCPGDLHGDQFVLYLPTEAEAHIDDDDPISQPVELTAIDTHYDNNSMSLSWEDPDWEVTYWVVERSITQDGPWEAIAAKRPGELRPQDEPPGEYDRWADSKLPPGERYYYRIYACTPTGGAAYSNVVSGVVPEFMPGLEPPIEAKEAVDPPC